ncbi:MAG: YkvA family protein [Aquirhabdus sp.]
MTNDQNNNIGHQIRRWASTIKRDVIAVWLAARDPRTPKYAKLLALLVAGYALSPIDLIPDFIPILGYLDDLIIVPLGLFLVIRCIPPLLMGEFRLQATEISKRPVSKTAAAIIILIWLALAIAAIYFTNNYYHK